GRRLARSRGGLPGSVAAAELVLDDDPEKEDLESLRKFDARFELDPRRRGFRQQATPHPAELADTGRVRSALDRDDGAEAAPTEPQRIRPLDQEGPAAFPDGGVQRGVAFVHRPSRGNMGEARPARDVDATVEGAFAEPDPAISVALRRAAEVDASDLGIAAPDGEGGARPPEGRLFGRGREQDQHRDTPIDARQDSTRMTRRSIPLRPHTGTRNPAARLQLPLRVDRKRYRALRESHDQAVRRRGGGASAATCRGVKAEQGIRDPRDLDGGRRGGAAAAG